MADSSGERTRPRLALGFKLGAEVAKMYGLDPNTVKKISMSIEPSAPVSIDIERFIFDTADDTERLKLLLFRYMLLPKEDFEAVEALILAIEETNLQGVYETHDLVMLRGYDWNRIVKAWASIRSYAGLQPKHEVGTEGKG